MYNLLNTGIFNVANHIIWKLGTSIMSSFLICMSYISFSYCFTIARTSRMTLNMSGECGHPCLVPDLRYIHSLTAKYDINYRFLTDAIYQVEKVLIPSLLRILLLLCFYHEWMLNFIKFYAFSASIEIII